MALVGFYTFDSFFGDGGMAYGETCLTATASAGRSALRISRVPLDCAGRDDFLVVMSGGTGLHAAAEATYTTMLAVDAAGVVPAGARIVGVPVCPHSESGMTRFGEDALLGRIDRLVASGARVVCCEARTTGEWAAPEPRVRVIGWARDDGQFGAARRGKTWISSLPILDADTRAVREVAETARDMHARDSRVRAVGMLRRHASSLCIPNRRLVELMTFGRVKAEDVYLSGRRYPAWKSRLLYPTALEHHPECSIDARDETAARIELTSYLWMMCEKKSGVSITWSDEWARAGRACPDPAPQEAMCAFWEAIGRRIGVEEIVATMFDGDLPASDVSAVYLGRQI